MKAYQIFKGNTNFYQRIGESDSLHGAKIIAGKHKDDKPKIYKAEHCTEIIKDDFQGFMPKPEHKDNYYRKSLAVYNSTGFDY